MANNQFSFSGTAYHFTEGPVFPSSLFASTEDNLADASINYIDPILQSPSSSDLYPGQWEISQEQLPFQRYLEDKQKTAFFNADVPSNLTPPNRAYNNNMRPPNGIPPVPRPSSHVRLTSPISSPGPSSSSDNMHSPPTDTDSHYEPFGSPPADHATLQLPFQQPSPFDSHWATSHEVQFVGMGPGDTCVNLHDINPNSQPVDCYENETSNLDLSIPQRGYSFESYTSTSQCEMEPTSNRNNRAAIDLPVRRLESPEAIEPVVKEEINASTHYPPLPLSNHDVEMEVSDGEPPLQPSSQKRKKSETDEDYKPTNKSLNLNTRRQTRRGVVQKSPQTAALSPPAQKKTKTTHNTTTTSTPIQKIPASPPTAKALPPPTNNGKPSYPCPECSQPFKDQTLLENHIKKQHTRPFICVFHFAGCPSTFASKNEWKRHVASQHLLLNYWLCDEGPCGAVGACAGGKASTTNGAPSSLQGKNKSRSGSGRLARNNSQSHAASGATVDLSSSYDPSATGSNNNSNGVVFNRKDLYTQHVRRMHMPPQIKKSLKQQQQQANGQQPSCSSSSSKKSPATSNPDAAATAASNALLLNSEWESRLKAFQSRAIRERCKLPLMMTCPAPNCEVTFHGPDSWDQRMEHVARHLEKAASGREPPVRFGNDGAAAAGDGGDMSLVEWASRTDVGIIKREKVEGGGWVWELNPLLKRGSSNAATTSTGNAGIVLLQSNSNPAVASIPVSGRRKTASTGSRATGVRFAPVVKIEKEEDEEEEKVEIKQEIVVTSSEDDDDEDEEKEIVVDGEAVGHEEDDDGLRDAEGEEEDDE